MAPAAHSSRDRGEHTGGAVALFELHKELRRVPRSRLVITALDAALRQALA
jgi:hypothetical protein